MDRDPQAGVTPTLGQKIARAGPVSDFVPEAPIFSPHPLGSLTPRLGPTRAPAWLAAPGAFESPERTSAGNGRPFITAR